MLQFAIEGNINFNSRPREGANFSTVSLAPLPFYFNSRPREGANGYPMAKWGDCWYFNSRPREGANAKRAPLPLS